MITQLVCDSLYRISDLKKKIQGNGVVQNKQKILVVLEY